MPAHYTLDVQPDLVRSVRSTYRAIAAALQEEASLVKRTPASIGDDWTGRAATTVKHDIKTLGTLLHEFHQHFDTAAAALKVLAEAYDTEVTALERLNSRRTAADSDHDATVTALKDRPAQEKKLDAGESQREAVRVRDRAYGRIDDDYEALLDRVRLATRRCAEKLQDATHVKFPSSLAVNLHDPSNYEAVLAALRDATQQKLGEDLELVAQHDAQDDASKVRDADQLNELLQGAALGDVESGTALMAMLKKHEGDPEFAALLAEQLDPKELAQALAQMETASQGTWVPEGKTRSDMDAEYLELLRLLGSTYGLASHLQGDNALARKRHDEFTEAITDPNVVPGQHIVIASLLTQGSWDPELLTTVTQRVIDFERDHLGSMRWSEYQFNSWSVRTPQGYSSDPVETLLAALANNRAAAQGLFTEGPTRSISVDCLPHEVSETLAYLLMDRRTNDGGTAIAAVLALGMAEFPGDDAPAKLTAQLQAIVAHGEELAAIAEAEAKANKKPWYVETGHFVLDLGGLVPLFGEVADLINAGWYLAEGDNLNAGLSAAGAIPFLGWGATGAKGLKGLGKMMPADEFAKLEKQLQALEDAGATLSHGYRNKLHSPRIDLNSSDNLALALEDLIPNAVYTHGDLVFRTDGAGRIVVSGPGAMRNFMDIGRHARPGTELSWRGHSFKVASDGTVDVIAISRFNPHWGHGEAFNAANWRRYPHNEIYLEPPPGSKMGRRLDSYSPGEEIVERKFRQYAELKDQQTLRKDIDLIVTQYPPKTKIPDTAGNRKNFPELVGTELEGKMILEIPPQNGPLDRDLLAYALEKEVTVRDTTGKVYTFRNPTGKVRP